MLMKNKTLLPWLLIAGVVLTAAAATVYLGTGDREAAITMDKNDNEAGRETIAEPAVSAESSEPPARVNAATDPVPVAPSPAAVPVKELLDGIEEIKQLIGSVDKRVTRLERDMDGLRLEQDLDAGAAAGAAESHAPEIEAAELDGTPQQAQQQQKIENYYARMDQVTTQEVDPVLSSTISGQYEQMINSREEWSTHASLKSVECGTEYCKVVVNYSPDMDPAAMFEFDPYMYAVNGDYPSATGRHLTQADGTTDMVLYFAKSQDKLPAYPN